MCLEEKVEAEEGWMMKVAVHEEKVEALGWEQLGM